MNVLPSIKNKGLKNWRILFIVAVVVFAVALALPTPNESDYENNLPIATELVTEKFTKSTEKPTEKLTEKQTEEVTEPPTEKPTEPPTEEPTEESTEAPTENVEANNNFNTYNNVEQQTVTEYVLNTSTMKIHRSSCSSVPKISPENVQYTYDLDSALNSGYERCKKCNP